MFCNICGSLLLGIPNENGVVTCFECYDDAKPDEEHINNKTTQYVTRNTKKHYKISKEYTRCEVN